LTDLIERFIYHTEIKLFCLVVLFLGYAYYEVGRYEEALATLKQNNKPNFVTHRSLAAVYVRLSRLEEARAEVSKMFEKNPHYTLKSENYRPYNDDTRRERLVTDLRKAGVPD
jgi:tetratricopeptide (TPR) repeat protein